MERNSNRDSKRPPFARVGDKSSVRTFKVKQRLIGLTKCRSSEELSSLSSPELSVIALLEDIRTVNALLLLVRLRLLARVFVISISVQIGSFSKRGASPRRFRRS